MRSGLDFQFPADKDNKANFITLDTSHGTDEFTMIFSTTPITNPAFFAEASEHQLTAAEKKESEPEREPKFKLNRETVADLDAEDGGDGEGGGEDGGVLRVPVRRELDADAGVPGLELPRDLVVEGLVLDAPAPERERLRRRRRRRAERDQEVSEPEEPPEESPGESPGESAKHAHLREEARASRPRAWPAG